MTSQHGQHGKPAALKFHCLSGFVSFNLTWILGAEGEGGGDVRYNKTVSFIFIRSL